MLLTLLQLPQISSAMLHLGSGSFQKPLSAEETKFLWPQWRGQECAGEDHPAINQAGGPCGKKYHAHPGGE